MRTKPLTAIHCRWLIRRDMPDVMQIERASFDGAWTEEDFFRCLRERHCIGHVAEHNGKIVGFMVYEMREKRLHILNFAVHPDWRRAGIGSQMVAKMVSKLAPHRRKYITAAVRETNLAAQLFFRSQEFIATHTVREFYEDSGEDAYWMKYFLEEKT